MTVATMRNGRFAEISIADTGPGVSEEAAKKIFDPFFSTKDHGMGMGLSIVRTIVEAHHGQIEVDKRERRQRRGLPSEIAAGLSSALDRLVSDPSVWWRIIVPRANAPRYNS